MADVSDDDDKRILRDGEKLVVRTTMMDALQKSAASASGLDASALDVAQHRRGYRVVSDQRAQDERALAYDQMVRAQEDR